jgi:hypothetical protein
MDEDVPDGVGPYETRDLADRLLRRHEHLLVNRGPARSML